MVFSSLPFIFLFLPITLIAYNIAPNIRWKNSVLTIASIAFYSFGEPLYVLLLVGCAFSGWGFGLLIDRYKQTNPHRAKIALTISIIVSLGLLIIFKYLDFILDTLNLLPFLQISPLGLELPIGISFFTFQTLSYDIDLNRGSAKVQKSFFNFLLYVSLFPQLIAGPILRYTDVQEQIEDRTTTPTLFVSGILRFIVGCSKKVLLANSLGELTEYFWNADAISGGIPVLACWVGALSYSLQLYFDFSGYSDMAIGLGRMFGFTYAENFDHPYISKSVSEYWQRWHISLGSFFRDYVYYPLTLGSGMKLRKYISKKTNRKFGALVQTLYTMLVVWLCTGLWHGASWNFVLWGLYFFVFLSLEKVVFKNKLEKIPVLCNVVTLLIIVVSRVLFYFEDISQCGLIFSTMFGFSNAPLWDSSLTSRFVNYSLFLVLGIICCLPIGKPIGKFVNGFREDSPTLWFCIILIFCSAALFLCISALVSSTYNPFLYFRF